MTERVITVGIGQFLLASATSGFSSYQKALGSIPSWAPIFFGVSLLSHILPSLMIYICYIL